MVYRTLFFRSYPYTKHEGSFWLQSTLNTVSLTIWIKHGDSDGSICGMDSGMRQVWHPEPTKERPGALATEAERTERAHPWPTLSGAWVLQGTQSPLRKGFLRKHSRAGAGFGGTRHKEVTCTEPASLSHRSDAAEDQEEDCCFPLWAILSVWLLHIPL